MSPSSVHGSSSSGTVRRQGAEGTTAEEVAAHVLLAGRYTLTNAPGKVDQSGVVTTHDRLANKERRGEARARNRALYENGCGLCEPKAKQHVEPLARTDDAVPVAGEHRVPSTRMLGGCGRRARRSHTHPRRMPSGHSFTRRPHEQEREEREVTRQALLRPLRQRRRRTRRERPGQRRRRRPCKRAAAHRDRNVRRGTTSRTNAGGAPRLAAASTAGSGAAPGHLPGLARQRLRRHAKTTRRQRRTGADRTTSASRGNACNSEQIDCRRHVSHARRKRLDEMGAEEDELLQQITQRQAPGTAQRRHAEGTERTYDTRRSPPTDERVTRHPGPGSAEHRSEVPEEHSELTS